VEVRPRSIQGGLTIESTLEHYIRSLRTNYFVGRFSLIELHDVTKSGWLGQRTIRRMLLDLRVPQLSWDSFARSSPLLQNAPSITADEFAAGFFEAFVL